MNEAPGKDFIPTTESQTPLTPEAAAAHVLSQFDHNQKKADACAAYCQLRLDVLKFEADSSGDTAKTTAFITEVSNNLQTNGLLPAIQIAALRYRDEEEHFIPAGAVEQKKLAKLQAEEKDRGIQTLEMSLNATPSKKIAPENYLARLNELKADYIKRHPAEFPAVKASADTGKPETKTASPDSKLKPSSGTAVVTTARPGYGKSNVQDTVVTPTPNPADKKSTVQDTVVTPTPNPADKKSTVQDNVTTPTPNPADKKSTVQDNVVTPTPAPGDATSKSQGTDQTATETATPAEPSNKVTQVPSPYDDPEAHQSSSVTTVNPTPELKSTNSPSPTPLDTTKPIQAEKHKEPDEKSNNLFDKAVNLAKQHPLETAAGLIGALSLAYWTRGAMLKSAAKPAFESLAESSEVAAANEASKDVGKLQQVARVGKATWDPHIVAESTRETVEHIVKVGTAEWQPHVVIDGTEEALAPLVHGFTGETVQAVAPEATRETLPAVSHEVTGEILPAVNHEVTEEVSETAVHKITGESQPHQVPTNANEHRLPEVPGSSEIHEVTGLPEPQPAVNPAIASSNQVVEPALSSERVSVSNTGPTAKEAGAEQFGHSASENSSKSNSLSVRHSYAEGEVATRPSSNSVHENVAETGSKHSPIEQGTNLLEKKSVPVSETVGDNRSKGFPYTRIEGAGAGLQNLSAEGATEVGGKTSSTELANKTLVTTPSSPPRPVLRNKVTNAPVPEIKTENIRTQAELAESSAKIGTKPSPITDTENTFKNNPSKTPRPVLRNKANASSDTRIEAENPASPQPPAASESSAEATATNSEAETLNPEEKTTKSFPRPLLRSSSKDLSSSLITADDNVALSSKDLDAAAPTAEVSNSEAASTEVHNAEALPAPLSAPEIAARSVESSTETTSSDVTPKEKAPVSNIAEFFESLGGGIGDSIKAAERKKFENMPVAERVQALKKAITYFEHNDPGGTRQGFYEALLNEATGS